MNDFQEKMADEAISEAIDAYGHEDDEAEYECYVCCDEGIKRIIKSYVEHPGGGFDIDYDVILCPNCESPE